MAKPSMSIDDEVLERVDSTLSYGDSRSKYFQHAARLRLQVDPILDEVIEPEDVERRIMFVEAAVRQEVDRVKENPNYDGPHGGRPGE